MIVQCPQCRKSYRLDDRFQGQKGLRLKCPGCQYQFTIGESTPEAAESTAPPRETAVGPAGRGKLLVADDSPYFRSMVGDILTEAGFQTIFAEDGEDALAKIRDESPDLVILDLHLPKISGFDVIKHVRQGVIRPHIPILVMSSVYTETSHLMTLDSLGANEFIDKKFKPSYLISKIKRLLEEGAP